MTAVLLQQQIQFFATPDANSNRVTFIVLGVILAIGIIAVVINSRRSRNPAKGGSRAGLSRQAKKLGLTPEQRKALKQMVVGLGLQNPDKILTNPTYMNQALRRRMEQLDTSDSPEALVEQEKHMLFSVKRTLQSSSLKLRVMPSSRQIRIGQLVNLRSPDGTTYESLVASNVHNGLGIEVPYQRTGSSMSFKKGTPIQVGFVADGQRMYSFRTRVVGYNRAGSASVMFLEHVTNIKQTQKRRSPRRPFDRPCYFYPVTVISVGKGKKARKQAFVNKSRRIFGRLEDLSAGGCAVRTQSPLTAGSIIKLDFEAADSTSVSVFGRIRGVERTRTRGRIMHIMFTRVSRKTLNHIQSFVYGLVEAD